MEVHHHAHTLRKRWSHYFWEFLMLFLAVFCGFLAEYQLEHKIEKDREKQYMASLLEDLQLDTTLVQSTYNLGVKQVKITDSLIETINTKELSPDVIKSIYLHSINTTRVINASFEDRTATQLKNSGGMRLVRKKIVADSILSYWQHIEKCKSIAGRLDYMAEGRSVLFYRLFHNKYVIRNSEPIPVAIDVKDGAKLLVDDPVILAEYGNRTFFRRMILNNYNINLVRIKDQAVKLMEVIRREYRL